MIKNILTISALVFLTTSVQASCKTSDLQGTWYAMGITGYLSDGTIMDTDQCKMTLSSSGAISAGSSSCTYRNDAKVISGKISSGKLTITSACDIAGSLSLCTSDGCANYKVERSKMDKSKETMTLLGYSAKYPEVVFSYTAVKK
jgi:hypothetical protein